jgi:predicted nucleotidyltransferase
VNEGFAVETGDGLVFTVKGAVHPPGRVVAYLRYVPDPGGERRRRGRRFRRVYRFEDQVAELRSRGLPYLVDDPVFGVRLQAVPAADVARVHDPCAHLAGLRGEGPRDRLEAAALALCDLLGAAASVPAEALGVTGSLLAGLHGPTSDLDLVVYGAAECRAVREAVEGLLDAPGSPLRRPGARELAALHEAHRPDTPLSRADFERLQARKVNEGTFVAPAAAAGEATTSAVTYFLRFVKRRDEVRERYGDPRYEPLGQATLRARVEDDADARFTPCRYGVTGVTAAAGLASAEAAGAPAMAEVSEVVSFRGRFSEQARRGEWVEARGMLERVVPRAGPATVRLTVGGQAGDYLLSLLSRPG